MKLMYCILISSAHLSKANAMCDLLLYDDVKAYIEDLTSKTHVTIQSFYAHSSANFPCVAPSVLQWKESKGEKVVIVDLPATLQFIFCIGAELGQVYVNALKNVSLNRSYSADIMVKM